MTTFANRPHSALLVIDTQVDVLARCHERGAVLANIAALVDRARQAGTPVVWVQQFDEELPTGSPGWRIVPELEPGASEPRIHKSYGDAFADTDLDEVLRRLAVGRVYVSGAQTDGCVRATAHGALFRGYDTTLVGDAHTTEDFSHLGAPTPDKVITHINLYWDEEELPGRRASTVDTAKVDFTG